MTQLTTALTTLNTTIAAGGVPVGGAPVGGVPVGGAPAGAGTVVTPPSTPTAATATAVTTPPTLAKQQPIDQKEINNTVRLMLEDGTGKTGIDRPLSLVSLRDILIGSNLNTQPEFKKYFSSSSPDQFLKKTTKIILVNAMQTTQKAKDVLDIVAYGMLTNRQSAKDSWKQMTVGLNHKDI